MTAENAASRIRTILEDLTERKNQLDLDAGYRGEMGSSTEAIVVGAKAEAMRYALNILAEEGIAPPDRAVIATYEISVVANSVEEADAAIGRLCAENEDLGLPQRMAVSGDARTH